MVAGWRHAKGATIAETALRWKISKATVKRYCAAQSEEEALRARHDWFANRWVLLTDRLAFTYEKRGGHRPTVRQLSRRIEQLEARGKETERALDKRGISYLPWFAKEPDPEFEARVEERRSWAKVLEIDDDWVGDDFDRLEAGGEWRLNDDRW
jgi:hypothetical protein